LLRLDVPDPEGLARQTLPVDGSIAQDLVRDDPSMARAAKQAATVLLVNAGVDVGGNGRREAATRNTQAPSCSFLKPRLAASVARRVQSNNTKFRPARWRGERHA
jgi:hypothetical protein